MGRPQRGQPTRVGQMEAALAGGAPWLALPIINRNTRLVAERNPARGRLTLQGWEQDGRVAALLSRQST